MAEYNDVCRLWLYTAEKTGCRQYVRLTGEHQPCPIKSLRLFDIYDTRRGERISNGENATAVVCNPTGGLLFRLLCKYGYDRTKTGFFNLGDIGENGLLLAVMKEIHNGVCEGTAVCFTYENMDCFKLEMLIEGFGFHVYEHINAQNDNYALDTKGRFFCLAVKK